MSVTRNPTVWCDGVDKNDHHCGEFMQESSFVSVRDMRRFLKKRGWLYLPGGVDLCPRCAGKLTTKRK